MTPRAWAAFAGLSVIWGVPYFFIKVALRELSPADVVWGRVALGAVVLLPLAWRRGTLREIGSHIRPVTAFAFVEIVGPFMLITAGERWISSSLTAILMATVPLMVVVLAPLFFPSERPGRRRLAGLALGLAGVVALLGIDVRQPRGRGDPRRVGARRASRPGVGGRPRPHPDGLMARHRQRPDRARRRGNVRR